MNFRLSGADVAVVTNETSFVWAYPAPIKDNQPRWYVVQGSLSLSNEYGYEVTNAQIKGSARIFTGCTADDPEEFYSADDKADLLDSLGIAFSLECECHECEDCGMYYDYHMIVENEIYDEDGHFGYHSIPNVVELIERHGHTSEMLRNNVLTESEEGYTIHGKTYGSLSDALESMLDDAETK